MALALTEVFILQVVRRGGARFVTSVGRRDEIQDAKTKAGAWGSTLVSHWLRDVDSPRFSYGVGEAQGPEWRLNERFTL